MLKKLMIAGSLASLLSLASRPRRPRRCPLPWPKANFRLAADTPSAHSDYGQRKIQGFSGFADYDVLVHWGMEADVHSLTIWTPDDIAENSYLAGPRFIYRKRISKSIPKAWREPAA